MSKLKAAEKTFEYFYERLLKGFRSVENREPNNLEMILIRQEAGNKARDAAKVIEVDFGKPFSKEIEAMIKSGDVKVGKAEKTPPYQKSQADIEFEIMEKIKSDNEKAVRAFESRNPKNKFRLNKERFKQDFNVTDEEVEKISLLSPEDQQKKVREYIDKDFKERIELSDYDVTDLEPNAEGGRAGYGIGSFVQRRGNSNQNQNMPAVDARMQNTYEQNTKLNQIQRNINERMRKGSKTQGLEIGQLGDMYGKKATPYPMNNPDLKPNEANLYGAAANMGLRPEQIKAVAYYNTLKNNFGDQGIGMAGPSMGLANIGGLAPGTNPFGSEKFFKTPAEQFALYQEGLRQQALQGSPEIYFDADKTYDAGDYVSPKGIYTFRDDEFLRNLYNNNTMTVDGKEYASEQDAIDDMGVERYNQFMSSGGRAGYYTGGMVDVEPSLSDIGHGSDALMARTRLVSPGSQSTTSTGLNYLLAEDNDNIRVPFSNAGHVAHTEGVTNAMLKHYKKYLNTRRGKQKKIIPLRTFAEGFFKENLAEGGRIGFSKGKLADAARRKFMKAAGAGAAGLAALKTGLLGFGKEAAPVIEKAVETAKGVPPYFFQLVDLIKSKGREIESYGERVKQYISPSKDGKSELMLTEDLNTGDIQVKKIFKENDDMVTKSEEMNFTKGRGDESTKGTPADDYEEVTEYNSRIYKDNFNDPDVVDGINVEDITKELIETKTKKASGGRIGFDGGGSPLQRLRQEIVDSMKGYAPGDVTEDQLQLVVKDITLDMTPEQAQASALSNFRKLFGMAKGGLAGMLGE